MRVDDLANTLERQGAKIVYRQVDYTPYIRTNRTLFHILVVVIAITLSIFMTAGIKYLRTP